MISTTVIIIGGGATGIGVLRDLSMRGIKAILLEQGGLAYGTSSRFHGLLHSGARYAVNDHHSAVECIEENNILRRIAKQSLELTEGFFASVEGDDEDFVEKWVKACVDANIPTKELTKKEALILEPNLSDKIKHIYTVPDSCVDGFRLVWHNAISARRYGGELYTHHKVTSIEHSSGKVTGVTAINKVTGENVQFACDYVVNASGSWAGEIASMAGLDVNVSPDRGTLIVFNHRFTSRVINRLHKSSDGDIFVPHGSVTILGTTSAEAKSPSDNSPTVEEVVKLLDLGKPLFPNVDDYRILRAFAGTRPLYSVAGSGRAASRNFHIVDHRAEGIDGMASIFGGKLTTYRLMAEKISDVVCKHFSNNEKCRTADEEILPQPSEHELKVAKKYFPVAAIGLVADRVGDGLGKLVEAAKGMEKNEVICECEMVTLAEIKYVANDNTTKYLNDIRLRTRLGMGTCQGTFCSLRGIAALEDSSIKMAVMPCDNVKSFLEERFRGIRPALWGGQMKEIELSRAIYLSTLNFDGGLNEKA